MDKRGDGEGREGWVGGGGISVEEVIQRQDVVSEACKRKGREIQTMHQLCTRTPTYITRIGN